VGAGATVGLGTGVGVSVGTAVGVAVGTGVGVAASAAGGIYAGAGGCVGAGAGAGLGAAAFFLMVKVPEVAVTDPSVATISTVPVGLLGALWTVVEAPVASVVTELRL